MFVVKRFVCAVLLAACVATPSQAARIRKSRTKEYAKLKVTEAGLDVSTISLVLIKGVEALSKSSSFFMEDPPNIVAGLDKLHAELWMIVVLSLPSAASAEGKKAWDYLFQELKQGVELKEELMAFATKGDTDALKNGLSRVLREVTELSREYFPEATMYFNAIHSFSDGVGEGWALYGSGDFEGALTKIWDALKIAVDELVPDGPDREETYKKVMGSIDGVVGNMSKHVLEYKKRIQSSKLCYRRTVSRERVRPNLCREGFIWDEGHMCWPTAAVAFTVQGSGSLRANGIWVQSGKHSGKPKYTKVHDKKMVIEWSESRGVWRMFADNLIGVKRETLYQSVDVTDTVPTTGWEAVSGLGKPPTISLMAAASLVEVGSVQNQSDVWFSGSTTPKDTQEAECNMDSEYNEKSGHWCLKACPDGFIQSGGQSCKQTCGGKYPAEGMGTFCAVDQSDVNRAALEAAIKAATTALDVYQKYQKIKEQGVDVESLTQTANGLIDVGKDFAHPQCPEAM